MAKGDEDPRNPFDARKDFVSGLGDAAGARIREAVDASKESFEELKKKSLEEIYNDSRDWIRKNPGKSVLGGLAVGFLLGRIFRRR